MLREKSFLCQEKVDIWIQTRSSIKYGFINSPLSADFTQANVYDNQIYPAITSSLPQGVRYVAADLGYDDYKLYNLSIDRGFELVYPTPPFK